MDIKNMKKDNKVFFRLNVIAITKKEGFTYEIGIR